MLELTKKVYRTIPYRTLPFALIAVASIIFLQNASAQQHSPRGTMEAYAQRLKETQDSAVLYEFVDWKTLLQQMSEKQRTDFDIKTPEELERRYIAGDQLLQSKFSTAELLIEHLHSQAQPEGAATQTENKRNKNGTQSSPPTSYSVTDVDVSGDSATAILTPRNRGKTIPQLYLSGKK